MSNIRHLAAYLPYETKRPGLIVSTNPDCLISGSTKITTRRSVLVHSRPTITVITRRVKNYQLHFHVMQGNEVKAVGQVYRPAPSAPSQCAFVFPFNRWNLVGHGTSTPSTEVATFPATNLYQQQPSRVWRTTSKTSQYVIRDLANPYRMNSFAIVYHNMSSTATFRLRVGNDATFATNLYDSGTQRVWTPGYPTGSDNPWEEEVDSEGYPSDALIELLRYCGENPRIVRYLVFNEVSARYARVDYTDPDNANPFIEVAYHYLGLCIPISPDQALNFTVTPVGHDRVKRAASGSLWTDRFFRNTLIDCEFDAQSQSNALAFFQFIGSLLGRKKEFLVSFQPENLPRKVWMTAYVHFLELPQPSMVNTGSWSIPMRLEELVG